MALFSIINAKEPTTNTIKTAIKISSIKTSIGAIAFDKDTKETIVKERSDNRRNIIAKKKEKKEVSTYAYFVLYLREFVLAQPNS